MKTRILFSLLLIIGILALAYVLPSAEARPFSNFRWNIDETYHRDGHVQFVVQKGTNNFLPVGVKGLDDTTVTLHPTINHDQTGKSKLPRGVDIYFEPSVVTLTDGEIKTVKLVINVDENAPSNLYDVQIVGTWKEEGKIPGFMGSSIRLHVGHDFGDGKIPVNMLDPPLKFWKLIKNDGGTVNDVPCRNDYVLVVKHDGSPACVKPVTKQHLIERGWAETKSLDEIYINPDLIKQNIVRIEDGHISLYPENMCASLTLSLPTEQDIQRYKNDENGLTDANILQITSDDLKEIPNIQELISAVHSIEFPYNKHSSAYLDIVTFVEYEFFLMDKAITKYGDSKGDYFIQIDSDYEERFTDPAKQGFTNHFIAPLLVYNENVYSIDGIHFWTSDEHKPKRMGVYPQDSIADDEKFIMLTEEDMKSVPKIKEAIENIGTVQESISAHKGLPENQWNEYREWFKQKSQERLNSDRFRLIQYDEHLYSIGFSIC